MTYRKIETANITRDDNQPRQRFDAESLDRLAASLKRFGMLQPITVTAIEDASADTPGYMIVDGERRFRAAQQLNWKSVPVILGGKEIQEMQGRKEAQLVANVLRDELLPSELAKGLKESQVEGSTVRDLEALLGIPKSEISDRVKALQAPDECKGMIDAGTLSYQVGAAFSITVNQKDADGKSETVSLSPADKLTAWGMIKAEAERTGKPITRTLARTIVKAVLTASDDAEPVVQSDPVSETASVSNESSHDTPNGSSDELCNESSDELCNESSDVQSEPASEYVSEGTQAELAAQQLRQVGLGVRDLVRDTQQGIMTLQGRMGDGGQDVLTDALCDMASEMDPEGLVDSINFLVKHLRKISDAAKEAHARRIVAEQAADAGTEGDGEMCDEPNCEADAWVDGKCYEHGRAALAVEEIDGTATADAIADLQNHVNGARVA